MQFLGKAPARPISTIGDTNMEKLNTKEHELTIRELDAVSGGAIFIQPPILAALAAAIAIRAVVHKLFR
jgi:hypothetical protein